MAEFVLQLHDIDDLGKDFSFALTPEWLDAALDGTALRRQPGAEPGTLQVHAQRNDREVLVDGRVRAELVAECSRCLGDAPLPVDVRLTALLSQAVGQAMPEEIELDPEDLDRATFEGNELVLDELVREHLLLECPMQPLCAPDCKGIEVPRHVRPRAEDFRGEGAIDPRLQPLQELKAKLSKDLPDDKE